MWQNVPHRRFTVSGILIKSFELDSFWNSFYQQLDFVQLTESSKDVKF